MAVNNAPWLAIFPIKWANFGGATAKTGQAGRGYENGSIRFGRMK
jgi:hypothetical protein